MGFTSRWGRIRVDVGIVQMGISRCAMLVFWQTAGWVAKMGLSRKTQVKPGGRRCGGEAVQRLQSKGETPVAAVQCTKLLG
jgi:hypothetical protein